MTNKMRPSAALVCLVLIIQHIAVQGAKGRDSKTIIQEISAQGVSLPASRIESGSLIQDPSNGLPNFENMPDFNPQWFQNGQPTFPTSGSFTVPSSDSSPPMQNFTIQVPNGGFRSGPSFPDTSERFRVASEGCQTRLNHEKNAYVTGALLNASINVSGSHDDPLQGSMSGVACSDDCITEFNEMKLKHTKRYIIYKIEDKKLIVIESSGDKKKTYDDFLAAIKKPGLPRYAVVDVEFTTDDGRLQEKLAFISYSPDDCGVKDKMLYASSKDAIKKKLKGFSKELQINDAADLAYEDIVKQMK